MIRPALLLCAQIASATAGELPVCPPDWKIELIASAPQINHPTVVCSAPDGRVFVAEDPMDISTPRADLTLGRIICFHPDGKRTIFAERLYAVFGMQYLEGKLYVLHNPKFSVFDDGGTLSGSIDGGGGTNALDYTAYTTDVVVILPNHAATGVGSVFHIRDVTGGLGPGSNILVSRSPIAGPSQRRRAGPLRERFRNRST